jgi:hypothetical protein
MANGKTTDEDILAQLAEAKARSRGALTNRIRARKACVRRGVLGVVLSNDGGFSVPTTRIPGLRFASTSDVSQVSIDAMGLGLHWPRLDIDVSVAALAGLVFGKANLLAAAGRAGGRARSRAKVQAARKNGLKGGRPRKPA